MKKEGACKNGKRRMRIRKEMDLGVEATLFNEGASKGVINPLTKLSRWDSNRRIRASIELEG